MDRMRMAQGLILSSISSIDIVYEARKSEMFKNFKVIGAPYEGNKARK